MVCFFVWGIILFGQHFFARAYDTKVAHPFFTKKIAQAFNQQAGNKLNDRDIGWLEQGSIEEDNFPRWMNHFYDPSANQGLWGFASSKDWAQGGWQDYGWEKALNSYIKGDRQSAMIALGHTLHLIEDAGVPAHTRNDAHPEGDPYENWTAFNIAGKLDFAVSPTMINSLSEAFNEMASYSHDYFLSKDTIGDLRYKKTFYLDINKDAKKIECVEGKDFQGNVFCLSVVFRNFKGSTYILDDPLVHSDYLSLLAPKVVSYGVGVVDLFFREAEIKKQQEAQKTWQDKFRELVGNKLLAGIGANIFSLPSAVLWDNRQNLTNSESSSQNTNDSIPKITSVFQQPKSSAPKTSAIIKQGPNNPFEPQPNNNNNTQEKEDASSQTFLPQQSGPGSPTGNNPEEIQPEQPKKKQSPPKKETNGGSAPIGGPIISPAVNYPETEIIDAPTNTTSATFAAFSFSSDKPENSFRCKIDDRDFEDCPSSKTYQNLAEGKHSFSVCAVDDQENADPTPANHTWKIDFTGPATDNVSVKDVTQNSARLDFSTNEEAKFQILWGKTESYGELSSASFDFITSHTFDFSGLNAGTTYHYKIETKDYLGNRAFSVDQTFTTLSAAANHLVISEIQTTGQTANDEWIEIYNPTNQPVDISGYSLQYRGSEAQNYYRKNFPSGATIQAKKFYLATNSGYSGAIATDMIYSGFSLSGVGGTIFLVDNQLALDASSTFEHVVDRVAYGAGSYLYPETLEFLPAPGTFQSIERKACSDSTAASLASGLDKYSANAFDSNNNSLDFALQNHPGPQNSASPSEPRDAPNIVWSSVQEVSRATGTASVGFPRILVKSDAEQEVVWHNSNIIFNNAYNKKISSGILDGAESLISSDWTKNKLISGNIEILEDSGKTYAFFVAIPSGFERMLFVSEKLVDDWSLPASMTFMNPDGSASWDLAFDSNSAVHFVWQDNNDGKVYYQKCALSPGIVCQAAQGLNQTNVSGIRLFIDALGLPGITYLRNSDKTIREASFDGANWNEELIIQTTAPSGSLSQYDAAISNAGELHFVWCEEQAAGTNKWDYYWATKNNGVVSVKEKIAQGLGQRNGLAITVNPNGNLYALSVNQGIPYQELTLWERRDGAWSAPQKIANQNQAGDYYYGYIVTADTGKIFIAWKSQEDTISKIYFIESEQNL